MTSQVFFMDYNNSQNLSINLEEMFIRMKLDKELCNKRVAIKIHMGEEGNPTYLRPGKIRKIADKVKKYGGNPFVCDTTTLYPYKRFTEQAYLETALRNGFTAETMGCPVTILDGDGYDSIPLRLKKKIGDVHFDSVPMAKKLEDADFLMVVSHLKGHGMSGIGGAIKNIAMGCVDKKGKAEQHKANLPLIIEENCTGCGNCIKGCKFDAMTVDDKVKIDYEKCTGCLTCYFTCTNEALYLAKGYQTIFQILMVHMSYAIHDHFGENIAFFNFMEDITPLCDCAAQPGRVIMPDIGLLGSRDPIAIDKASIDLLDQTSPIPGTDVPEPPDRFGKLHGLDSSVQIKIGESLGMGSSKYELIKF